jgi:hypothetical protein
MTDLDLDQAAADLKAARQEVHDVLAMCAGYVDMRAASGDPSAQHLATRVAAAHDRLTATSIAAATVKEQHQ